MKHFIFSQFIIAKRKKILIFFLLVMATSGLYSQTFFLVGGLNESGRMEKSDSYVNEDLISILRYHAGIMVDYEILDYMSLQTGLVLTNRGYRYKNEIADSSYKYLETTNIYYLDVPIQTKWFTDVGSGIQVYGLAGFYIGFGIKALYQEKTYDNNDYYRSNYYIEFGDDINDNIKRMDFGLITGAGVKFKEKHAVQISYDLGLVNISPFTDNGYKEKNRVFKLSYIYFLNFEKFTKSTNETGI